MRARAACIAASVARLRSSRTAVRVAITSPCDAVPARYAAVVVATASSASAIWSAIRRSASAV